MKIEVRKKQKIDSYEDFKEKLESAIDELNSTREAPCWVCDTLVMNWGVIFPGNGPDALGLGSSDADGKKLTRIAFFPYCPEHDLEDEEIVEAIHKRLDILRQQLAN